MEEGKSRVAWSGNTTGRGNADGKTEKSLKDILDEFGIALEHEANISKLDIFRFPIFRKFEIVGIIIPRKIIYIISSPPTGGGFPISIWLDLRQAPSRSKEDDLLLWNQLTEGDNAVDIIHKWLYQQFGWKRVWVLELDSELLDNQPYEREKVLQKVARDKINHEIEEIDKEKRIVKFNPIFRGREFIIQKDLCFVLMPFKGQFSRIYDDYIKPALASRGLKVMKADDSYRSTAVVEDIWKRICESRLIVADITDHNPNVLYELGIAHTLGKEFIILTQNIHNLPFDLRYLRVFDYSDTEEDRKNLRTKLEKAVDEIVH